LFDGHSHRKQGIQLSGGCTKSITEGGIKFFEKSLEVSLSASIKQEIAVSTLISHRPSTDSWLIHAMASKNQIISLLHFHLSVDAISKSILAPCYLKKWLGLPRCATLAILYYPIVCCPSVSVVSRDAKLSVLSCISVSEDSQLQQLGLQLHSGDVYLQTQASRPVCS